MRKVRLLIFLVLPLLVLVGISVASAGTSQVSQVFATTLSGDEEVPPRDTKGHGMAHFQVSDDGLSVDYKVVAANIISVTAGHIHTGTLGVNGPVVVGLISADACTTLPGRGGVRCEGTFTADDLVGPLAGQPLSALLTLMEEERAYVNVHTTTYPGGEIRGQINRGP